MALINCPECDAQVSTAAASCPKCGYPIAESVRNALGATESPKPKKKPMSKGGKIAIGLGVALFALVAIFGDGDQAAERGSAPTSSAPVRQARQPVINVQLSQLVKECEANQVAFEDNWKRKTVRLRGVVKEIDAGFSGGALRLRKPGASRWDSISANGIPRETLATLKKGEEVTLECERVFEVMGDPSFADCRLPYR